MHTGRVRSLTIALAVVLGASAPVLASPGIACAAAVSGGPHAALVVDTGAQATSFCVALDRASVSGTHLIELASAQYGLSYRLGFGGRAVCMLDGVGATGNDCFGGYPNFWGYFHGAGSSGWTWASGSAADHQVGNGDREAWSWGAGDSGTSHGAPPTTIDDACGVAPPPDPSPSPSPPASPPPPSPSPSGGGGSSNADGSNAGGGTDPGGGSNAGGQGSGQTAQHSTTPQPSTSPSPTAAAPTSVSPAVVRAAAVAPPPSSGPPLAGIVALGAIALLGAGGVAAMRRRRGPG